MKCLKFYVSIRKLRTAMTMNLLSMLFDDQANTFNPPPPFSTFNKAKNEGSAYLPKGMCTIKIPKSQRVFFFFFFCGPSFTNMPYKMGME